MTPYEGFGPAPSFPWISWVRTQLTGVGIACSFPKRTSPV
jgi:hypothetical protein